MKEEMTGERDPREEQEAFVGEERGDNVMQRQLILRKVRTAFLFSLILCSFGCGGGGPSGSLGPSPNPVPGITTLLPSSVTAGAGAQILTINGTNFLSGSTVTFNSVTHTVAYVSATQLTIQLSVIDQAVGGNYPVVVTNPAPGGGASNSGNFTVNNPTPQIASLSPATLATGSPATVITVSGTNFVATSQILLNGSPMATTYVSSSELTAAIPASILASGSSVSVAVVSAPPGGGTTSAVALQLVSVASLALLATPATVTDPTGAWQAFVMAEDGLGNPIADLPITMTASQGTLSASQGVTDTNGSFSSTVTPPAGISATEAVGLQATIGGQSVSATISFAGTSATEVRAGNSAAALRKKLSVKPHAEDASTSTTTVPLAFGLSTAAPGSTPPFAAPSSCYTFASLSGPVSAQCATLFQQEGFSLQSFNPFQAGCSLANVASTVFSLGECAGAVAVIPVCIAGGAGSVVTLGASDFLCAGYVELTVTTLGPDCAEFILNDVIGHYSKSAKADAELMELSIDPIATDPLDYVVTYCDNSQSTTGQSSGSIVAPVAGNGNQGFTNGPALSITLNSPTGIAIDANGNVYFDDYGNNVIRKLTVATNEVTTFAGTGAAGYTGDTGPAAAATLNHPTQLAFDVDYDLYIADAGNNVIRKVTTAGIITTVAGTGVAGYFGDGSSALQAKLNFPDSLAFDASGNLYIADAGNNVIREVTSDGVINTVAGNGTGSYGGDNGPATKAELNEPTRVVVDAAGNLYISDLLNNRVREVNSSSGIITTIAGDGAAGYQGDNNAASSAELNEPLSVALDTSGNVYIADLGNRVIRVVNMQSTPATLLGVLVQPGDIATVVGRGTQSDVNPGASLNVSLSYPTGLLTDTAGNLYFADADNNVILRASNGN
jgi:hypothetical protein